MVGNDNPGARFRAARHAQAMSSGVRFVQTQVPKQNTKSQGERTTGQLRWGSSARADRMAPAIYPSSRNAQLQNPPVHLIQRSLRASRVNDDQAYAAL